MTRILIVDDQPSFRRHLRQLMIYAGLEVVGEAGDIPSAEALLPKCQAELAVVDILLPGINGLEGTQRLKAISPGLRVILVSAYSDQASLFQASALAIGAEAFIPKDDLDIKTLQGWKAS
jgi:DNA-binding NarL/FixJ family response regulator